MEAGDTDGDDPLLSRPTSQFLNSQPGMGVKLDQPLLPSVPEPKSAANASGAPAGKKCACVGERGVKAARFPWHLWLWASRTGVFAVPDSFEDFFRTFDDSIIAVVQRPLNSSLPLVPKLYKLLAVVCTVRCALRAAPCVCVSAHETRRSC